jgi:hypothetical protein
MFPGKHDIVGRSCHTQVLQRGDMVAVAIYHAEEPLPRSMFPGKRRPACQTLLERPFQVQCKVIIRPAGARLRRGTTISWIMM